MNDRFSAPHNTCPSGHTREDRRDLFDPVAYRGLFWFVSSSTRCHSLSSSLARFLRRFRVICIFGRSTTNRFRSNLGIFFGRSNLRTYLLKVSIMRVEAISLPTAINSDIPKSFQSRNQAPAKDLSFVQLADSRCY